MCDCWLLFSSLLVSPMSLVLRELELTSSLELSASYSLLVVVVLTSSFNPPALLLLVVVLLLLL